MRPALTLLLLAFLAFWPQIDLAEWRGTEGRRVQIALEMHRTAARATDETLAGPDPADWAAPAAGAVGTRDLDVALDQHVPS